MYKPFFVYLLLSFSTTLFFYSCTTSDVLPSSSGKPGELVVVVDSNLWKGNAGKALLDSLTKEYPALPQFEPCFNVVNINPGNFKSILQLHRNILIVDVGPLNDGKHYSLTMKENVWSKPQIVMNLRVIDPVYLSDAVKTYSTSIMSKIQEHELRESIKEINNRIRLEVSREVQKIVNINIPLTEDYFIATSGTNYCWIRKETIHSSMGFQIYRFPYTNKESFSADNIIHLRDSLSKKYIPGPSKGSYMESDTNYTALITQSEINGLFSMELRGLWRTHGDFMGGPFVSYLINDESNGSLIFIDGYVYAPKFNKKDYVKFIEATVHSIDFN